MWLGIHKYICLIQSIHMGVVRHTCVFKKVTLQYAKTELGYDVDFLYTATLWQQQQIATVISNGLINSLVFDPGFSIGVWSVGKWGHSHPISGGISKTLVKGRGRLFSQTYFSTGRKIVKIT